MGLETLSIVGLFVGLAGGLFGIGGGIVLIPALNELFGPDQHRYQAAALIVNFFVAVPAVYQHVRVGAIAWPTVIRLLPLVIIGVLIGVALSELAIFSGDGEAWLRLIFAAFLLLATGAEGLRLVPGKPPASVILHNSPTFPAGDEQGRIASGEDPPGTSTSPQPLTAARIVAIAGPTGLIAGLLGVGGGVVAVPLQRRLLQIPIRRAIANSAAMIIGTSFLGAITKNIAYIAEHQGSTDALALALMVAPAAVIGSLIGSHSAHRLPVRWLKILFIALLLFAAARMAVGAVNDLRLN